MSKHYARPDGQSDSDDMDLGLFNKEQPRNKAALVVMCDEENFLPTVAIVDPNRPHGCRICAKTFKWKHVMKRHEANHSGKKPWRCSECNKRFARKDNAVVHQLLHSDNPKPWSCPVCKKDFSAKRSAKKHVNKVHGFDLPEIPKKEKQNMAVIGNEGDLDDTIASPRGAIDAIMKPSKPGKEGNAPPVDDITLTPSPGRKRKLAQDCDVDSVLDYSQPASNASPTQSVKRAKRNANPKGKEKERSHRCPPPTMTRDLTRNISLRRRSLRNPMAAASHALTTAMKTTGISNSSSTTRASLSQRWNELCKSLESSTTTCHYHH